MSDHISGPRALAEPVADITDVYAFPSPENPGHLVLIVNTLPFAPPDGRFSDGLMLRVWERSTIRNDLMERADKFVTGTRMSRTVGVEEWFNAAGNADPKRPLWKKLSFEVLWVYPAALLISVVLAPLLVKIPLGIRVLTSIAVVTVVMQFVVMPIRKRLRAKRRF